MHEEAWVPEERGDKRLPLNQRTQKWQQDQELLGPHPHHN